MKQQLHKWMEKNKQVHLNKNNWLISIPKTRDTPLHFKDKENKPCGGCKPEYSPTSRIKKLCDYNSYHIMEYAERFPKATLHAQI